MGRITKLLDCTEKNKKREMIRMCIQSRHKDLTPPPNKQKNKKLTLILVGVSETGWDYNY